MHFIFLYLITVLIWGTTWLAIKLQLGEVAIEVSIFYRFALASLLLFLFCKLRGLNLKFKLKDHFFLFLLGLCTFSVHLLFIYKASQFLVSGLVSTIFSLVSFFNILNAFLFFKKRPESQVVLGATFGCLGISFFFWDEISHYSFQSRTLAGVGFGLLGALLFSLGNIISWRNQLQKFELVPSAAIAMGYGATIMLLYSFLQETSFILPMNKVYWGSLLYLVVPGSIIGFLCYLTLVNRIGPEQAGYATVFFPVIAIIVSVVFENYRLTLFDFAGMACVLVGNFLIMGKKRKKAESAV